MVMDMTEKYCPLPKSICEFGTNKKADCENCELNKRYTKRTVDNWESYIVDNKTGEEYGNDINPLLDLLNEQEERIKELQQTINTIAKDYEYSHGMDIRNAEWFTAW